MANSNANFDDNHIPVMLAQDSTNAFRTIPVTINPVTGGVVVDIQSVVAESVSITGTDIAADGFANPTTSKILTFLQGFNGTTWDRIRAGLVGVQTTFTGFLNTINMARYNLTPPTLADGNVVPLQGDVNGNLKDVEQYAASAEDNSNGVFATQFRPIATNTYAPSVYAPLTQVTKNFIKSSAGNVISTYITNDNATVRYFQLHNKATAPAGTDVPQLSFKIPAGTANNPGVLILDDTFFTKAGNYFSTGIGWAVSTTFATFTDSATNTEHIVVVNFK